ncbi:MAG: NAD(P)H-dependent oxidoreductase subunit E [Bacteroidota bacterium]|nr:NAD(P)H-dependent oxidoreductase subunit E [Bacteroidota bacterium]
MKEKIQSLIKKYSNDRGRLMDILLDIQGVYNCVPAEAIDVIADHLDISRVDVEQTMSFYHFFTKEPAGKFAIYLNNSAVANIMGREDVAKAFEKEVGTGFNSVSDDGLIGLWDTADIGMNDQEPAALINGVVFTKLTPAKVKELVKGFKNGKDIHELHGEYGDGKNQDIQSMVNNNIRKRGPVLFSDYEVGMAIRRTVDCTPEHIIDEVKKSNIRGRGGAGFPAGLKWEFCRQSGGEEIYLVCNADEGEPGTFKERVILTELPKLLFEGMILAGYALNAKEGILYLRYEYKYMKDYLENVLQQMRNLNLLGNNIAGKAGFTFDIRIQLGAGAYVCGEESGLIESLEGKRGEPRNRPPFPVQKGYKNMPTVVNNVETLGSIVKIILNGSDWFKAMGTKESAGTKLLSISGDCKMAGVYEIEWGITIKEMLDMVGASSVQAVQVGGPSGTCINPSQFNRIIAFEDIATGGSMIVIGKNRDLLKDFVLNFMEFFIEESCSSCGPCRSLTVILKNKLLKIMSGNGVKSDIDELYAWGKFEKEANRCGLGQTAANPILTTIENFRNLYEDLIKTDEEFISTFDMEKAVADSCEIVGRAPNIKAH